MNWSSFYCLRLTACLLIFWLAGNSAIAQERGYDYTFRIKVAASKTPIPKTSKLYKDFPEVEALEFPDGYIRYFVGEYETFHKAKEALPDVQAKGYKDAYVVCIHDGKILTGDEAIMEIYEGK